MDINLSQNNLKDNRDKKIDVEGKGPSVTLPLAKNAEDDMSDTGEYLSLSVYGKFSTCF